MISGERLRELGAAAAEAYRAQHPEVDWDNNSVEVRTSFSPDSKDEPVFEAVGHMPVTRPGYSFGPCCCGRDGCDGTGRFPD